MRSLTGRDKNLGHAWLVKTPLQLVSAFILQHLDENITPRKKRIGKKYAQKHHQAPTWTECLAQTYWLVVYTSRG